MPEVTVGVPADRPSALPMAITASPTCRFLESPNVTACKLGGGELSLSSAASLDGSVPTIVAGRAAVCPYRVTVMVVAPEMTWLLVSTSPELVMIIPVPWSSTVPPNSPPPTPLGPLASMETTSGSTLFTMVGIEAPPASAGPGVSCPTLTAGAAADDPPVPTASAMPAPTAPPTSAATTATTIHRCHPRGPEAPGSGAGSGAGHPGLVTPGGGTPGTVSAARHAGADGAGAVGHLGAVGVSAVGADQGDPPGDVPGVDP